MKYAKDYDFVKQHVAAPPYWSGERLLAWSDVFTRTVESFVTHSYWTETGSLNVFRVVGTDHPDYIGKTWLEFLQTGKRMSNNLHLLEENPRYYLEPYKRNPRMLFTSLDGLDFYVSSDGNHRTCLSRFFLFGKDLSQLHDVSLTIYKVDEYFLSVYRRIDALIQQLHLPIRITPDKTCVGREDTAGWKLDKFEPYVTWEDGGGTVRLSCDDAVRMLAELEAVQARSMLSASKSDEQKASAWSTVKNFFGASHE